MSTTPVIEQHTTTNNAPDMPDNLTPHLQRAWARFWSRVSVGYGASCWEWLGSATDGYGRFRIGRTCNRESSARFRREGPRVDPFAEAIRAASIRAAEAMRAESGVSS